MDFELLRSLDQTKLTYNIDGQEYQRLRYHSEPRLTKEFGGAQNMRETCHDCGCAAGELHLVGCDVEECPKCHEQAIMCGHIDDYINERMDEMEGA